MVGATPELRLGVQQVDDGERVLGHDKRVHGDMKQMLLPGAACGLERLASHSRRYD